MTMLHKLNGRTLALATALAPAIVVIGMNAAFAGAANGSTSTLPWEGALSSLAGALTGSTAKFICIIAIFIAGVALIFGEDLGQFAKRLLMVVIAAAFLVGAGSFVANFVTPSDGGLL